jgi:hypothetical protein
LPFLHGVRSAVEKRQRNGPECNSGIRNRCARRQLLLRKERTSGWIFRETTELQIAKGIVGSSTGLGDTEEGSAPSEKKEETFKAEPSGKN